MSCPWFMEWILEVKSRVPVCKARLHEVPGAALRDWESAFVAKRITRDEAFAVIPAIAVSPPYVNRLAARAIDLVLEARKAKAGPGGISPAERSECRLGCSSGWLAIPERLAPVLGMNGYSMPCECSGGVVPPYVLEAIRADREERDSRGTEVLRSLGVEGGETSAQLGRSMREAFGRLVAQQAAERRSKAAREPNPRALDANSRALDANSRAEVPALADVDRPAGFSAGPPIAGGEAKA